MNEKEITQMIEEAKNGSSPAFGRLVEKFRPMVYAICVSMTGNMAESEDLTQEVFVAVYRNIRKLRETEKFAGWLRKISRNMCRMWLRKNRSLIIDVRSVDEIKDPPSPALLSGAELSEIIRGVLAQVTDKSREVLALHYIAGFSEQEIAMIIELSQKTVKSRLYEGRSQAKERLIPVIRELLSFQTRSSALVAKILARCNSPGCKCPDTLMEGR